MELVGYPSIYMAVNMGSMFMFFVMSWFGFIIMLVFKFLAYLAEIC
jgi:hypothetical protein